MSELGTCTNRHACVVYDRQRGYEHPSAITLARLASRLVDSSKQGLALKWDKWTQIRDNLNTIIPEYLKPKGERRTSNLTHTMDILVIETIPTFQDVVLGSFHAKLQSTRGTPIDPDIKAFYDKIRTVEPLMIQKLRKTLIVLREDWKGRIARGSQENRQQVQMNPTLLSPRNRLKRSISGLDKLSLVRSVFSGLIVSMTCVQNTIALHSSPTTSRSP